MVKKMYLIVLILLLFGYTACENLMDKAIQFAECLSSCHDNFCSTRCNQSAFIPQVTGVFNATLHCKDTDLLTLHHNPGVFVVQQESDGDTWGEPSVIQGPVSMHLGLEPGQNYRYRVYRVTNEGIFQPEFTNWFQTTKSGVKPQSIKEIIVQDVVPNQKDLNYLQAQVSFLPGEDLSCFYDILNWSSGEDFSIVTFNATRGFKFYLRKLGYSVNHTVIIQAKNKGSGESSEKVSTIIETPSCLMSRKSLMICAPNKVTGLNVRKLYQLENDMEFTLSWDEPEYVPDNYTVMIHPLDNSAEALTLLVPGNLTKVSYYLGDEIGLPHMISIIAESQGGVSQPVTIINNAQFDKKKITLMNYIFLILMLLGMIMVVGACYIYWKHKKSTHKNQYNYCPNIDDNKSSLGIINEKLKSIKIEEDDKMENDSLIITKDHFEIRPVQLKIGKILGSGVAGVVRIGSLEVSQNDWIDVAVKMLQDGPSEDDVKNFHQEMLIMKSAGIHRNIVSMIGCCTTSIRPMLIVEYCSRGDLQTFLRNIWKDLLEDALNRKAQCQNNNNNLYQQQNQKVGNEQAVAISNQLYDLQQGMLDTNEEITATDLLSFAHQVATGMEFLSMNRIIHRDLAARNILVCADGTVKISDFGLSRDIYQENIYRKQGNGKLPIKWMAIEALTDQTYTSKSDVWSFGILLWEIVTLGCSPYPDISTSIVLQLLKEGYRMARPQNCGTELYEIMRACWNTKPRCRPTFTKLKQDIDKLLETVSQNDYLNLCDIQHERIESTDSE